MYSPVPPDCVSRCTPFASLVSTTFAPTTAPPLGSVTVPRIRPPVLCPLVSGAYIRSSVTNKPASKHTTLRVLFSKNFITSPLSSKLLNLHPIFEVAVPHKPYYNPANLWDDGHSVKKKEFIQSIRIAFSRASPSHQRSSSPRRHFFFRSAGLGISRPRRSATHAKQISPLHQ